MTIEEALHELKIQSQVLESMILYNKDFEPKSDNTSLENKKNAIDMAIAALERQILKKPLQYEHDYICLCCGYVLAESVDDNCDLEEEMAGWCPYCDRKLTGGGGIMNKIELEVMDNSAIGIAHALIKYYIKCNAKKENALIDLEEVSEHINAFVNAERKSMMLEVEEC